MPQWSLEAAASVRSAVPAAAVMGPLHTNRGISLLQGLPLRHCAKHAACCIPGYILHPPQEPSISPIIPQAIKDWAAAYKDVHRMQVSVGRGLLAGVAAQL